MASYASRGVGSEMILSDMECEMQGVCSGALHLTARE